MNSARFLFVKCKVPLTSELAWRAMEDRNLSALRLGYIWKVLMLNINRHAEVAGLVCLSSVLGPVNICSSFCKGSLSFYIQP